ncbi:MAG TPA: cytochrome c oxidase subunit 3 [Luteibaculaceae bacterium]|jgi:cytochrome c oxidase subunit III|nr:cytochrome c oxidase subunit 3 [Luteibaculaceae bacterium]
MAAEAAKVIDKETLWGGKVSPFSISYGKLMMWFFLVSDALTFGGLLVAYGYQRHKFTGEWPLAEDVFHSLPFVEGHFPLIYVALMTFILIVSSVTMVLAVEAGHRLDKKGIIKWLAATVFGGFFFLGSQAWEWSHFIHGSHGYLVTESGQKAFFETDGHEYHENAELYEKAAIRFEDGKVVKGAEAKEVIENSLKHVQGANLHENEYGPQLYANFFFFITGFHGFHVFSGVIINLLILIQVIRGVYDSRGHYEMVEKAGLYWHFVDLVWVFVFTFFYLL